MKTILLLILIIFISNSICLAEFENYFEAEYIANHYYDICCTDSSTIFICGDFGVILKSGDSGFSWKKCDTKTDVKKFYWFSSIASNGNTVIAVGSYGLMRISFDKGETWVIPDSVTKETLRNIVLKDSETGVAFGYSGTIIKTSDAGFSWKKVQFENSSQIITSVFTRNQNILIATSDCKVYKSTDKGDSWLEVSIPDTGLEFQDFSYSFDNKLYLLSKEKLLKSVDEGDTWTSYNNPVDKSIRCTFTRDGKGFFTGTMLSSKIFKTVIDTSIVSGDFMDSLIYFSSSPIDKIIFWDDSLGYAIGHNNLIYKTLNGGKDWSQISFLSKKYGSLFGGMFFLNDSIGFLGADRENVFKTTDSGITWKLIPKGDNEFDYQSISRLYFQNELKGLMATSGLYSLLTTEDGFKTIKREWLVENNGASTNFTPIDNDTYFLFGNRRFYDNEHFYMVYKNYDGNWWNQIVMDSVSASVYNCTGKEFFIYGAYVDSVTNSTKYHNRGLLLHTLDSGKTFERKFFNNLTSIYDLHFLNETEGFFVGNWNGQENNEKASVYKTSDGGENWFAVDLGFANASLRVRFMKEKYAFGPGNGEFLYSEDINNSWRIINIDTLFNASKITSSKNYIFASGRHGQGNSQNLLPQIMRIKLKDEYISVEENDIQTESAPLGWIYNAYPNPAGHIVNFFVAWGSQYSYNDLKFNVFNLNGDKITNPNFDYNTASENTGVLTWHTSGLTSGIYFIEMDVKGYKKVQKVIVY